MGKLYSVSVRSRLCVDVAKIGASVRGADVETLADLIDGDGLGLQERDELRADALAIALRVREMRDRYPAQVLSHPERPERRNVDRKWIAVSKNLFVLAS